MMELPKYQFEELAQLLGIPLLIDADVVAAIMNVPPEDIEAAINDGRIHGRRDGEDYEVFTSQLVAHGPLQSASTMMLKGGRLVPRPRFPLRYVENYYAANNRWFDLEDAARLTGQQIEEVWADWYAGRILAHFPNEDDAHLDPEPDLRAADPKPNPGGSGWWVNYLDYVDDAGIAIALAQNSGHAPPRQER